MFRLIALLLAFCLSAFAQDLNLQKPSATEPCSTDAPAPCAVPATSKPKVRAITAFIRIDTRNYQSQVQNALLFLRAAKAAIEKQGYQVEGIRITTQPFADYIGGMSADEALRFFKSYDELAVKENFDANIGPATAAQANLLARIVAQSKILEGSVQVANAGGIDWEAVHAAGGVMKYLEDNTAHSQGNFNFTASADVPEYTPFFPASWHNGPGKKFALALESANVIADAFSQSHSMSDPATVITQALAPHAQAIEKAAMAIAQQTGWEYRGIDLSPAPLKDISIGAAMEKMMGHRLGESGTMTAAAAITRGLRAVPVKQAGYSGLMIPILEDSLLAQRWAEGAFNVDALLAYSAVCGTGLDTIPLPGDIAQSRLEAMIGDMASLAVKWHKPLAARLLPVKGKSAGERTDFDDPFLVNTTIQKIP